MHIERLPAGLVLMYQSVHYEYAEIISKTEDECGQNDIHDIEPYIKKSHQSQDHHPADTHRDKGDQSQFDPAV